MAGLLYDRSKGRKKMVKPYDKEFEANKKVAFKKTNKSVKDVAKDTNKTRRKRVKPTKGKI